MCGQRGRYTTNQLDVSADVDGIQAKNPGGSMWGVPHKEDGTDQWIGPGNRSDNGLQKSHEISKTPIS